MVRQPINDKFRAWRALFWFAAADRMHPRGPTKGREIRDFSKSQKVRRGERVFDGRSEVASRLADCPRAKGWDGRTQYGSTENSSGGRALRARGPGRFQNLWPARPPPDDHRDQRPLTGLMVPLLEQIKQASHPREGLVLWLDGTPIDRVKGGPI